MWVKAHIGWTDESSSEDQGKEMQEEDDVHEQTQERDDERVPPPLLEDKEHEEVEGWGESNPEALPGDETCGHGEDKPEMEPRRQAWEWASIMEDEQLNGPITRKHVRPF